MKRYIPVFTITHTVAAIVMLATTAAPATTAAKAPISMTPPSPTRPNSIALVGGTLLDLSNFGNSYSDRENSTVLIEGDKITAVGGRKSDLKIPSNAQIINTEGKYILPGLIDGFGALDNQAYANAYLYMGITSVVSVYGGRRSPLFEDAEPGPNIFRFGFVGKWKVTDSDMLKQIEEWADQGVKFLILQYELRPEQVRLAVAKAHELGMVTVGELGQTSYKDAIECGIDAFIHSGRYCMELAPPDMQKSVAANPFGPPARTYRTWLAELDPEEDVVIEYAGALGSSKVALMPTLALHCIDLPFLENPWNEPAASIIDANDIFFPLDRSIGKHILDPTRMELIIKGGENTLRIERKLNEAGARYLAGSGTDVFGTMPGISLHQELELLTTIGLSERQALAAATYNYAEAFNWKDIGQVKPGCRADIIAVDKNPLENIKNLKDISLLIVGGTVIDRGELLKSE